MLTRIDHVMICVRDLAAAQKSYSERLGFHIYPGGDHPGRGTHNSIGFFDTDYLELLGVRDHSELERVQGSTLLDFLRKSDGLRFFILASDDIDQDVSAVRSRGLDISEVVAGSRRTPQGTELSWRFATLGPRNPLPFFFIQHLTPDDQRQAQAPQRAPHPNGSLGIDHVAVAVPDLAAAAGEYQQALGMPASRTRRDAILNAQVVSFPVGRMALLLAAPEVGLGPAQEALDLRGPGPFLVAFRTASLGAAERWALSHHIPISALGTTAEGTRALLTLPELAHGVWMEWVDRG